MSASVSRGTSEEDSPFRPTEYKLENFDMIKTIGTGNVAVLRDVFMIEKIANFTAIVLCDGNKKTRDLIDSMCKLLGSAISVQ